MPASFSDFLNFIVFFIYGLAFFSMGLVLMIETGRAPSIAEVHGLIPLALFGFIHGIHEWIEMALMQPAWFPTPLPDYVIWLRLGILALSFLTLQIYVLRIFLPGLQKYWGGLLAGLAGLFFLLAVGLGGPWQALPADWVASGDAATRYFLAIPGALAAAIVMQRLARQAALKGNRQLAVGWNLAAYSFAGYAFSQSVVRPNHFLLGEVWNTSVFYDLFSFPIQGIRATLAVLITIGLILAVQAMEKERQEELVAAQKARLEALEQMQSEARARVAMHKNLLRYTVLAQEEERTRIARELHDETAQLLTAISLNLAALGDDPVGTKNNRAVIHRLQDLGRQMSQGIYRLVHDLRPAQLDDLGLTAALKFLADESAQRLNLDVKVNIAGNPQRLDNLVETVIFRIAQEALTNVARHAQVNQALVNLTYASTQVTLQVIDQGVGFNALVISPEHRWGLAGMQERADSINGKLEIQSAPDLGTTVELIAPLGVGAGVLQEAGDGW